MIFWYQPYQIPDLKTTTAVLSEIDSASNIAAVEEMRKPSSHQHPINLVRIIIWRPSGADFEGKSVGTLTPYVNHFGISVKWSHLSIELELSILEKNASLSSSSSNPPDFLLP